MVWIIGRSVLTILYLPLSGGNSKIFYVHPDPWGDDPIWLIFFKWVETTNQYIYHHFSNINRPFTSWSIINSSHFAQFLGHHQFHVATPSPQISLSGPNQVSCSWLPWLFAVYRGCRVEDGRCALDAQWKNTWLFRVYRGWSPTQFYGDYNEPRNKDPYDLNRSWGDIADLYASDEKDAIRNGVRSGCKGAGIQETWSRVGGNMEEHPGKWTAGTWDFHLFWLGTSSEPNLHFWVPC